MAGADFYRGRVKAAAMRALAVGGEPMLDQVAERLNVATRILTAARRGMPLSVALEAEVRDAIAAAHALIDKRL